MVYGRIFKNFIISFIFMLFVYIILFRGRRVIDKKSSGEELWYLVILSIVK